MNNEHRYHLALSMLKGVGPIMGRALIAHFGNAEALFAEKIDTLRCLPRLGAVFASDTVREQALAQADRELEFLHKKGHTLLIPSDSSYPYRLKECEDAPLALFINGVSNLNATRMIAVVGTRKITDYGREICRTLIAGLHEALHDCVIVSGLAYGIDAAAHKEALSTGLPTFAVEAHGLDMVYPAQHRSLADKIVASQGALITEYPTNTIPDPANFVQRNRIIAGLCDCTVVVESALKGGALLTAVAANSYNRDVFAFPGRTTDQFSAGCNRLINTNQAALINSADDLVRMMDWQNRGPRAVEQTLFVDLSDEEQQIVELLRPEPMHIDTICRSISFPVQRVSSLLIMMEFKGLIKALPGQIYKV